MTGYGSVQRDASTEQDKNDYPVSSATIVELSNIPTHSSDESAEKPKLPLIVHIDDAIERLGMGRFQLEILMAAGLCFAADAMEVLLLSFLAVILQVEWNLSVRRTNSIIAAVFAGAMIGTLILGPLGDKIGRKPVFSLTAAIIAIFGLGSAAVPNYEWFLLTRFMVGFGVGGLTVPFDTLAEFVPTSHRGRNLLYIEFFWTGGTLLVPILAWWSLGQRGSWQTFVVVCAVPCVLSTILGLIYVPESPRWLLTKGRHDKAVRILREAARRNNKDPFSVFPEGTELIDGETKGSAHASIGELFSPQWRKITLLLWGVWFGLAFLYYGVIFAVSMVFSEHQVEDDFGHGGHYEFDYSAILISASSEVVGLIIVLMTIDKWGRIATQTVTYIGGGTSCLLLGCLASVDASRNVLIFLAFLARMFMMGGSCTTWVSTTEILPTEIRATGHSAANALARIGGFLCPYIISEGTSLRAIGVFIFAVSMVTGLISWLLPETQGKAIGEAQLSNASRSLPPPITSTDNENPGSPREIL